MHGYVLHSRHTVGVPKVMAASHASKTFCCAYPSYHLCGFVNHYGGGLCSYHTKRVTTMRPGRRHQPRYRRCWSFVRIMYTYNSPSHCAHTWPQEEYFHWSERTLLSSYGKYVDLLLFCPLLVSVSHLANIPKTFHTSPSTS
jgi:hypothetical protein